MKVMIYILWYGDGRTLRTIYWRRCAFVLSKRTSGKGVAEIAKLLGVHWGVYHVGYKMARDGQRALKERKATGRPPKLDCKRHGKAI